MRYIGLCLSLIIVIPTYSASDDSLTSMVESAKNSFKDFCNRISINIWTYQNPLTGSTVLTGSIGYQSATRPVDAWGEQAREVYGNYKNLLQDTASRLIDWAYNHPQLLMVASSQVILLIALAVLIKKNGRLAYRLEQEIQYGNARNNYDMPVEDCY